jgi:hypothetical protein
MYYVRDTITGMLFPGAEFTTDYEAQKFVEQFANLEILTESQWTESDDARR